MNDGTIKQICLNNLGILPDKIKRCVAGQANYVYSAHFDDEVFIVRCSPEAGAYDGTAYWLSILSQADIPVPKIIGKGRFEDYDYLVLTYIDGEDIGDVYTNLTFAEKKGIAKEIVTIQRKVSALNIEADRNWSWLDFISDMLERSKSRIIENGFFDAKKVERLREESKKLNTYFSSINPNPYLDDISTKNLLISSGKISGIIDVDEMGFGDTLTYVALTYMALLNYGYDTDYVGYILEEMKLNKDEKRAFLFYSLLYCVDFMGERGMTLTDKKIEISPQIIDKLNGIYEMLWDRWLESDKSEVDKT